MSITVSAKLIETTIPINSKYHVRMEKFYSGIKSRLNV